MRTDFYQQKGCQNGVDAKQNGAAREKIDGGAETLTTEGPSCYVSYLVADAYESSLHVQILNSSASRSHRLCS